MSVYDRVQAGEFENRVAYPSRPAKPKLKTGATPDEIRIYADQVELFTALSANYGAALAIYRQGQIDAESRFEHALAEEYGLVNHPKRAIIFDKAWEYGHSSGLGEVALHYDSFAELVA